MQTRSGFSSARALTSILLLTTVPLLVAVGCGGSDGGGGGGTPNAGSGGDAGETTSGEAGKASGGKGGAGKAGAASTGDAGESSGGAKGDAGDKGDGGEAGGAPLPPAQNTSAISFMAAGAVSKSKNFFLISGMGESLGGTVGSLRSKSLKYTYIPGVIAASSN